MWQRMNFKEKPVVRILSGLKKYLKSSNSCLHGILKNWIFFPEAKWWVNCIFTQIKVKIIISSVQSSRSVLSDSLRPHESQHARSSCPSPTPGVHPDSRPQSQWCHPAISFSVVPFSSCLQSLPASESFPMSQLFAWGGQSTGVSALASFLPKKIQGWSPSEWTGWTTLQSKGLSKVFFQHHSPKASILQC